MISMYVVTHKDSQYLPKGRKFIGVGKNKKIRNVYIYDDSMDNIAEKNNSYCELTALYWIWKNDNSDFVSLEHYRRFFYKRSSLIFKKIATPSYLEKKLNKYDVIVSKNYNFKQSIKDYYSTKHFCSDLEKCEEIIKELYPEYMDSYFKIMNGKKSFMCNMFFTSKKLTNEYCDWLFKILFKLEKSIDISERDSYQKRVFGFLAERLFNVWVDYRKLSICHLPIFMPNEKALLVNLKGITKKILNK